MLLGFFDGDHARTASSLSQLERQQVVEDCLHAYFGDRARESIGYIENDWCHEPWSGGAYGGRLTTGGWTTYGLTLRQPHGRIHFAGTETATIWNGCLDGASAPENARQPKSSTEAPFVTEQRATNTPTGRSPVSRQALAARCDENRHGILMQRRSGASAGFARGAVRGHRPQ